MQDDGKPQNRFVGFKQSKRAIEEGVAVKAFVAQDCSEDISTQILDLCKKHGVEIELVPTMEQLGSQCGIDVGSAVAVITRL